MLFFKRSPQREPALVSIREAKKRSWGTGKTEYSKAALLVRVGQGGCACKAGEAAGRQRKRVKRDRSINLKSRKTHAPRRSVSKQKSCVHEARELLKWAETEDQIKFAGSILISYPEWLESAAASARRE